MKAQLGQLTVAAGFAATLIGIVGLAAGLDKGAELLPLWKELGFGFVEIGTVTPKPQPGNPKPRLFRLPAEGLILNRMGFNSEGAEVVARRLKRRPAGLVVGGNLGKNKVTPEEQALADYRSAYRLIAPGTVEEKIWELQQSKAQTIADVLGEEGFARSLSKTDLEYLFSED